MEDYTPNSHKSKKEQKESSGKKIEKVVSGNVKSRKKSEVQKFADVFISEDVSHVKSYILMDVLVPAIKKAVSDIITNGVDMILYGESGHTKKSSTSSKVSYRSYYGRDNEKETSQSRRGGFEYDDIILDSRGEAEEVLASMDEIIDTYGLVSIADLYDLVGLTGKYTYAKYGWTNLSSASVIRARDGGYLLKLPKVLPLN